MQTFFTQEQLLTALSQEDIDDNYVAHQYNGIDYYCLIEDNDRFINPRTKKISNEEVWFAIYLELKGIEYETEPKFIIFRAIQTSYKNYKDTTYKPDYLLSYEGRKIIVEVKGYIAQDKTFKYNVYDRRLKELYPEYEYYIVKWAGSHKQQNKTPYLYRQTPASMRINNFETLVLNKTP